MAVASQPEAGSASRRRAGASAAGLLAARNRIVAPSRGRAGMSQASSSTSWAFIPAGG
jgi:hypothetical protein